MAIVSKSSNTWLLSAKILLVSTAVLTAGVVLKLSVPVAVQFMVSVVPVLWNSMLLWLAPPYLYVVINGIIIMIVASSRYTQKLEDPVVPLKVPVDPRTEFSISATYDGLMLKNSASLQTDFGGVLGFDSAVMTMRNPVEIGAEFGGVVDFGSVLVTNPVENRPELQRALAFDSVAARNPVEIRPELQRALAFDSVAARNPVEIRPELEVSEPKVKIHVEEVRSATPVVATDGEFDDFLIKRSTWMPIRMDAKEIPLQRAFVTEKPSASIRFSHRKPMKASPEAGRTLGVSKPKRHDTLESTWKTITDGRSIPLARHLKKSDTWETHGRHRHNIPGGAEDQAAMKMKKSETFNERGNKNPTTSSLSPSPGSGKLKKEPSLSQDELNRRVEAFIKKFNEDMRLQRQESLNQYKEMVKRG